MIPIGWGLCHNYSESSLPAGWWFKPDFAINELNINSAITSPAHDENQEYKELTTVKGYAYAGSELKCSWYDHIISSHTKSSSSQLPSIAIGLCLCVHYDSGQGWHATSNPWPVNFLEVILSRLPATPKCAWTSMRHSFFPFSSSEANFCLACTALVWWALHEHVQIWNCGD